MVNFNIKKKKITLTNYKNLKQESRAMSLRRYIKRNEDIVKSKNGEFQYKEEEEEEDYID